MIDPVPFFHLLIGKPVSRVWRGHGSALFIEFGELNLFALGDNPNTQPKGEFTLMIEWSWRIESKNTILLGSWSDEEKWLDGFNEILGRQVVSVELFGYLPEIMLSLSGNLRVLSFNTSEGQPCWALISNPMPMVSLCVKEGRLAFE